MGAKQGNEWGNADWSENHLQLRHTTTSDRFPSLLEEVEKSDSNAGICHPPCQMNKWR